MPQFTNRPPEGLRQSCYRLIRTPPNTALVGHVISADLEGCPTHFVGNRTIPCEQPNCQPCSNGVGWRWHSYLLVLVQSTQETVIFEMTALAAKPFEVYHDRYDTLRGAFFKAQRLGGKPNGRILIQAKPADLARVQLPPDQDIQKLLCHIWNISPKQLDRSPGDRRPPIVDVSVDRTLPELTDDLPDPDDSDLDFIHKMSTKVGGNGENHIEQTGT